MVTLINSILTVLTLVILTTVFKKISKWDITYRRMKLDYRRWLSQFDDPDTHD